MEGLTNAILLLLMVKCVSPTPIIQAPWGSIQGLSVDGDEGRKMDGYLGIPYALPPVGDLRFEKPQPHPGPGEGKVFVANQVMPACLQVQPGLIGSSQATSEDCLMLNVYMPPADENLAPLYPVMVFFHGGGFSMGDAPTYRPSKLVVDEKMIVVVVQYRLGALGFFSSGDEVLLGNQGLWDQNLALCWVKDNIRAFGGDPDIITIFGESAGSMSVGLQMFSPQSRGLFKRVIMQSGAPQTVASQLQNTIDRKGAFKAVADLLGCKGDSTMELIDCLKQQPAVDFFNKSTEFASAGPLAAMFFPVVDGVFLPRPLKDLAEDEQYMQENGIGDIDVIMGFNNMEGSLVLFMLHFAQLPPESLYSPQFFHTIADICLMLNQVHENQVVRKAVEFFYRGADAGTNNSVTIDAVTGVYGDCLMTAPIVEWMRHLVASPHSASRYLYVMDHDFSTNKHSPVPGSHHGDELALQFDNDILLSDDSIFILMNKTKITADEQPLSAKFIKIVTQFAKTGNPSAPVREDLGGDWPEFTTENEAYLSISKSPRVVKNVGLYRDRTALWLKLVPELAAMTSQSAGVGGTVDGQQTAKDEL